MLPPLPRFLVVGLLLAIAPARAGEPSDARAVSDHWAFRAPVRPGLPEVKDQGWVRNPIDRFILAGLESIDFKPSPEADRVALIRRVTFDLTGLPPSPSDVDAFLADQRLDAYERVVNRLLASPSMASARPSTGSTWPTTPTRTDSSSTPSGPTPGVIATGS